VARLTDAEAEAYAKKYDRLPDEIGFHVQDGLFFRRLDDGRVRISVIKYTRVRGSIPSLRDESGTMREVVASVQEVIFSTIMTPESWASCMASVCARGEDSNTWEEAQRFHWCGEP
jgi:hypothetical protein